MCGPGRFVLVLFKLNTFGKLILRKIIKTVATTSYFTAKCT